MSERLRNLHMRYKSRNLDNDLCAAAVASHVRSQGIRAAWRETHACTHLGVRHVPTYASTRDRKNYARLERMRAQVKERIVSRTGYVD